MIDLNKEERENMLNLSKDFVGIHNEILSVERTIKDMEERSAELILILEECREAERMFILELEKKYGHGTLDPINLVWKKEDIENEVYK